MANQRLTDRTELNETPNASDLVHVVDISDTTDNASGTSKKVTRANLVGGLQTEPSEGAFANGDKTKLDGIETGATADQTGAEIKVAYEAEADTNAFTDALSTKLAGIETGADVTDATNVTSAGALMDSEVTNLAQVKAFSSADYATAAQGTTADSALQPGDAVTQLDGTANRVLYVNGTGDVTELGLGSSGTYLKSNGASSAPSFDTPAGGAPEGTAVLSTGETVGKVLQADGDNTCSWVALGGGGDALVANPLSQFAATTSAQLAGVISDETGSGALVFGTSPTLTTPTIGAAIATSLGASSGGLYTPSNVDGSGHHQFTSTQTLNSASGTDVFAKIAGTINNSGTAETDFVQLDMTTTAAGSGAQNALNILNDASSVFSVGVDGVVTGLTVEATGATSAGDNAAMGYDATDGLILTGQGSTNDITLKNDAGGDVLHVPTGTLNIAVNNSLYIKEQGAGEAELPLYGQLWVRQDTPNVLLFTDDGGNDRLLAHDSTATLSSLTTVGTLTSGNADAIVSASSTTTAGKIEIATDAEFTTGTDTARAVTADQVASIAQTMTNKRITDRTGTTASSASLTIDSDSYDRYTVTALAAAMTINAPSGTPTDGQKLIIRIKDNATARALTWNAAFRAIGVTLPTTTVISKTMYIGCMWNSADSKWDATAVAEEA